MGEFKGVTMETILCTKGDAYERFNSLFLSLEKLGFCNLRFCC